LLLNQTDDVAKRLATKGVDPETVYQARDAALRRRRLRAELDQLRAEMNRRSREVGRLLAAGGEGADQLRRELTDLKGRIAAAKLGGSGFSLLRGDGARLLRALVAFGLVLIRGTYEELVVPHLVRRTTMVGTGHLPKFADDAYSTTLDDLWLIPTGEVPIPGL